MEVGDRERAGAAFRGDSTFETRNPAWLKTTHLCAIYLARLEGNRECLLRALDDILSVPWDAFVPTDRFAILPVAEAVLATETRRPPSSTRPSGGAKRPRMLS